MRKRISKYKHLHSNRFRYLSSSIPLVCASGLLVTFGMMIAPWGNLSNGDAYADITMSGSGSGSSTGTNSTVSIELDEPKVTDLSVGATTSEVAYISKGFTVTASDDYNIYVQTANNSSDLTNGKTVVRSIAGSNVAPASFTDNTWGYTVAENKPAESSLTYNAIPTRTTHAVKSGNDAANGKQFTLAFAAKFGDSATAGHYKTGVVLSVAANPGGVTSGTALGFGGVTTMQELTQDICTTIEAGTEGRLKDIRDDKIYWVGKMLDGSCWMTQNLDLNLDNTNINSKNTDITSNFQFSSMLKREGAFNDTNKTTRWLDDNELAQWYDPGNWVSLYNMEGRRETCSVDKQDLGACTEAGWVNLDAGNDLTWTVTYDERFVSANSYIGTDDTTICTKIAGWPIGTPTAHSKVCRIYYYDYSKLLHYAVGNYYSWQALVSKSIGLTANGLAAQSICPKNWKIPTLETARSVLAAYSFSGYTIETTINGQKYTPYTNPLYFVFNGNVNSNGVYGVNGMVAYFTNSGYSNGTEAHNMVLNNTIGVGSGQRRYTGSTVRCLVPAA